MIHDHQALPYERDGEWLSLSSEELLRFAHAAGIAASPIEAGSHPHHVRIWLLALGLFPEKWLNRLFSVGGIQFEEGVIRLKTFLPGDPGKDAAYRMAQMALADGQASLANPAATQGKPATPQAKPAATQAAQPSQPTYTEQAEALFRDDWCLVMNKPAGMPVHPSAPGQRGTLDEAAVRDGILHGDLQPAKHIHRLDDDTAGPVLYARNELAQLRLDEAMREKTIGRQYAAIIHGVLKQRTGTVNAPIGKDRHHRSRRRVTPDGDHAVTHYETVEVYKDASLVRVWLETGRTHQIRVHMSNLGHPLIGDTLYGGRDAILRHQALRGEQLSFRHPWRSREMTLTAPEPAWFSEVRRRLASL
ncbi:RluA family pseudouridine synthase [Paenibacillus rhizovicinus]|uniref:Pseudouridine synthase n=1 Tax=Paenibacillus rhizovicinus TaxID=2704463 RepID=A0A6C0P959_9BACL|nr:RluA family pseudouridine synthase [Paenibacillus rhizovicinus]QHW34153.1 RluA family pseudouridine synthase [Paenibacillus rhizovicinus]